MTDQTTQTEERSDLSMDDLKAIEAKDIPDLTIAEMKETKYKFTDEVLRKLILAFEFDATDEEACAEAGITRRAYTYWRSQSSEFAQEIDNAKTFLYRSAKKNVAKDIRGETGEGDGNVSTSLEFLKRRQKHLWSERIENTGKDGDIPITKVEIEYVETGTDTQNQGDERAEENGRTGSTGDPELLP